MRVKSLLVLMILVVFSSLAVAEDFSVPRMLRVSLLEGDVTISARIWSAGSI